MKLKLRAIIPSGDDHASVWWRIKRPFLALQARGHDATWHTIEEDVDFRDAVVIIHRLVPNDPRTFIANIADKRPQAILYSIDDLTIHSEALRQYLEDSGAMTHHQIDRYIDQIPRQIETINMCDALICSTYKLATMAQKLVLVRTQIMENALDTDFFVEGLDPVAPYRGHSTRTFIGWAGGRRPESDLEPMAKAWHDIAEQYEHVYFMVGGWQSDIIDQNIPLDRKIRIPWKTLEEWPSTMQVDIGCCPLEPTIFNKGKSPIKYYEYSMAGAAVVASYCVYDNEIIPYVTGLLATTTEDWYEQLSILIENKELRQRLNKNAQYDILNYKSLKAQVKEWEYWLGLYYENPSAG